MSNERRGDSNPSEVEQEPLYERAEPIERLHTPTVLQKAPSSLEGLPEGAPYQKDRVIGSLLSRGFTYSRIPVDPVEELPPIRLGIDLDGVGYEWDSCARYILRKEFGYKLSRSDSWDYIQNNISKEAWKWLWTTGITEKGLYRHGHMITGYKDGIQRLKDSGFTPVIITSRPEVAVTDTLEWLAFHRIPTTEVHILGSQTNKTTVKCDLYIDDGPKNIREFQQAGVPYLIWHQPWNYGLKGDRVDSWEEVRWYADQIRLERGR